MTDEAVNLLASIDERLKRLEEKAEIAEKAVRNYLNGPGKKLLRLFGGG